LDVPAYYRTLREIDPLFAAENYQAMLDLLERAWPGLPDAAPDVRLIEILLFKAFCHAQLGRPADALAVFRAMLRCGLPSRPVSPAYAAVRELPEYAAFARENEALLDRARREAKVEFDVHVPAGLPRGARAPLFVVLHGEPGNRVRIRDEWPPEAVTARGVIAAYVQSSQFQSAGRYLWSWDGADPARARADVRAAFETLCRDYPADPDRVVLGGFSGGATTALDVLFGEIVPAVGFVCLCAGDRPEAFTTENLARAKEHGVRGIFFEGEKNWPDEDEQALLDAMRSAGLATEFVLNPGCAHEAPPDFAAKLGRALEFVLGTSRG
jgi:predicted esterase